jgi:STAM-binding protein
MTLHDEPRQYEPYSADAAHSEQFRAAREDDARRRREWEEEGRHRTREQRRQEQDGILRRQREADLAARAARVGQPTGQNHGATIAPIPAFPTPAIQYPSVSGPAPSASASSGSIAGQLLMPLESPTRCVILDLHFLRST